MGLLQMARSLVMGSETSPPSAAVDQTSDSAQDERGNQALQAEAGLDAGGGTGNSPYVVVKGDTLGKIAERATGDAKRYTELMAANGLESDVLEVGQALDIPPGWDRAALGLPEAAPAPTPQASPAAEASPADAEEGWDPLGTLRAVADSAADHAGQAVEGVQDWAGETAEWAGETADVAWDAVFGGSEDAQSGAPSAPAQEQTSGEAPAVEPEQKARLDAHKEATESGKTDVLAEAIALKDTSSVGHADDVGRSQDSSAIWDELKSGEIDDLEAIKCSEFTSAAVAAAGYDLEQDWIDPDTGMRAAYEDKGSYTFIEIWMVVGLLTEATHAMLAIQAGQAEEIDPSGERAAELGMSGESEPFLYVSAGSFVDMEASEDQMFGAGAAAVALGGDEVELDDRKPGDIQQSLNTNSAGEYIGTGHSSIVHAVRGSGVAKLGEAGSPEVEGDVQGPAPLTELAPGWYRIRPGSGLKWVVGPDTDPATIAQLDADDIQLIDANIQGSSLEGPGNRGGDATAVGSFQEHKDFDEDRWSATTSTGRLPSSPWYAWSPGDEDAVELSTEAPAAVEAAAPTGASPGTDV